MSVQFNQADFYSPLDTVRFRQEYAGPELAQNLVSAAGTVMLGLLIGGTRPILTQAQAFDSAYLLNVLSLADGNSSGLLQLIRHGFIGVKFHDNPPLLPPEPRLTLLNAFATALNRQKKGFLLSGWPEINDDASARSDLVRAIKRVKTETELLNEVEDIAGATVAARFAGLLRFSEAIADSGPPAMTTRPPDGTYRNSATELVRTIMIRYPDSTPMIRWLLKQAQEDRIREKQGLDSDLDVRSGWLALVDDYAGQGPTDFITKKLIRRHLDYASSTVIAQSLQSTGKEVQTASEDAELVSAGTTVTDIPVHRLVAFSRDPARLNWLNWASVADILGELGEAKLAPDARYRVLIDRHTDSIFQTEAGGLPAITVAISEALGRRLQDDLRPVLPGTGGRAATTLVGQVVVVLAKKAGDTLHREMHRRAKDDVLTRWDATLSDGTASWQDEISGRSGLDLPREAGHE